VTYVIGSRKNVRRVEKPMPVPMAIGSKIDTAGCSKTNAGNVSDGM
jgi:hypothetical protein